MAGLTSSTLLFILSVSLVQDVHAAQLKPNALYKLCPQTRAANQSQSCSIYCDLAGEVCNITSGLCQRAPAQEALDVAEWYQCRDEITRGATSLPTACSPILKLLQIHNDKHGDDDKSVVCSDDEYKSISRLAIVLITSAAAIVFIAMSFCWFKGWICFNKSAATKDKLKNLNVEVCGQDSAVKDETVDRSKKSFSTIHNFGESINYCTKDVSKNTKFNQSVQDLLKSSNLSLAHNLYLESDHYC